MLALEGEVLIKFSNQYGKQTKPDVQSKNIIYNKTLLGILGYSPTPYFAKNFGFGNGARVTISAQNTIPNANNNILTEILATGDNIPGEESPIWFEDIEPNFGQIINSFPAPGFARTFNSVALTLRTPNNNEIPPNDFGEALTTVLLSIPCTQESTEILTIFYFLKIIDGYRRYFNKRFLKDFGGSLFAAKNCYLDRVAASYALPQSHLNGYENLYFYDSGLIITRPPRPPNDSKVWDSATEISTHYKFKQKKLFTIQNSGVPGQIDMELGRIFNSMLTGISNTIEPKEIDANNINYIKGITQTERTNTAYRMQRYRPSQVSQSLGLVARIPPFQPTWGHRPGSSKPFFEQLFKERGNGIIKIAGNWNNGNNDLPTMYRIEITNSGGVGVATYKFSKRYHVGFEGNTWINRINGIPFRNPNINAADGMHGWKIEDNDLLRFSNTKIVQYDSNGVTLLDILTGEYKNFDSTTSPSLNTTTIRQCAVDSTNQLIYVACRDTGLHLINIANNTITIISSNSCYGVDIGLNNIAYGLFNDGLKNSVNWSVNLPINFIGLTDNNWNKCFFIRCNRSNSQKQIAIIIESPSNSSERQIIWYSDNLNTTNPGASSSAIERFSASFNVSSIDDFWVDSYYGKHSFNNSTRVSTSYTIIGIDSFNHPVWGNIVRFGRVDFYDKYLISNVGLIDKNGNTISYNKEPNSSGTTCHLIDGSTCFGSELMNLLPYESAWTNHGWDGANWIKNNSFSKTTHPSIDNLIDGLNIQFINGSNVPQFESGDYYTQSINLGTLKDNSIAIYYENFWYTKKVNFDTPINISITSSTAIFPEKVANSTTWIRLEDDSIDGLCNFLINGVEVLKVWTDSTLPNQNEISINAISGVITFNSADIGKTLTGFYAWIEDS